MIDKQLVYTSIPNGMRQVVSLSNSRYRMMKKHGQFIPSLMHIGSMSMYRYPVQLLFDILADAELFASAVAAKLIYLVNRACLCILASTNNSNLSIPLNQVRVTRTNSKVMYHVPDSSTTTVFNSSVTVLYHVRFNETTLIKIPARKLC
jgi:hypothetical protein